MKTLYIDCGMGAAGDMLTAALLEIACRTESGRPDREAIEKFASGFNKIGIPGVGIKAVQSEKMGITGTHVHIYVNGEEEHEPEVPHEHGHHHHHVHRSMKDIEEIISIKQVQYVGIEATIFLCRATVREKKWLFELKYTIRTHSWCLMRKVY